MNKIQNYSPALNKDQESPVQQEAPANILSQKTSIKSAFQKANGDQKLFKLERLSTPDKQLSSLSTKEGQKSRGNTSKRGRNQPSQQTQFNGQFSDQKKSIETGDINHDEILIVRISQNKDSWLGNDQDIYELERIQEVYLLDDNQNFIVKNQYSAAPPTILTNQQMFTIPSLTDQTPSMSLENSSLHNDIIQQRNGQDLQIGVSSLRQMIKQKSMRDLKIQQAQQTQNQNQSKGSPFKLFKKAESDIEFQENQACIINGGGELDGVLVRERGIFSCKSNLNGEINQQKLQQFNEQDCSQSRIFRSKSISHVSQKLDFNVENQESLFIDELRDYNQQFQLDKDQNNFMLNDYESPSERTILDVLGLQSNSKNIAIQFADSQILINNNPNNLSRSSPILLIQTNNQITDQHSSNQILYHNQTGSENSFSTNKFIHNFAEEKKRELEALEEDDHESDTTEQMTFSQNSRSCSKLSQQCNILSLELVAHKKYGGGGALLIEPTQNNKILNQIKDGIDEANSNACTNKKGNYGNGKKKRRINDDNPSSFDNKEKKKILNSIKELIDTNSNQYQQQHQDIIVQEVLEPMYNSNNLQQPTNKLIANEDIYGYQSFVNVQCNNLKDNIRNQPNATIQSQLKPSNSSAHLLNNQKGNNNYASNKQAQLHSKNQQNDKKKQNEILKSRNQQDKAFNSHSIQSNKKNLINPSIQNCKQIQLFSPIPPINRNSEIPQQPTESSKLNNLSIKQNILQNVGSETNFEDVGSIINTTTQNVSFQKVNKIKTFDYKPSKNQQKF